MTRTPDTIIQTLAAERDGMVDLTRDLIAIPTENPPGTYYHDALELLTSRPAHVVRATSRLAGCWARTGSGC
jgi:hypothetical protein